MDIFDTTKTRLETILNDVHSGSLQLPDFQRGWVWDDDRIKSLLASVAASFPIGSLMLLETTADNPQFKPRTLTGANKAQSNNLREFVLDGQQRLTSLFQALMSQSAVETKDAKGKVIQRRYFIDMLKATNTDSDLEEAVISVPEDYILRSFKGNILLDLSTEEKQYDQHMFPVNNVFRYYDWHAGYLKRWNYNSEQTKTFVDFIEKILKAFAAYQVPIIKLKASTPKEAICIIFERVNAGGVALNVFELLTASFAAKGFPLRDDWHAREKNLKTHFAVLKNIQNDDFLQAVTLLTTLERRQEAIRHGQTNPPGISCKRKDILGLTVKDWVQWAPKVEEGFRQAARFLHKQKIFRAIDVPYRTQVIALAAIFAALPTAEIGAGATDKLSQWFWCGVLGELYGGSIETRLAKDLDEVVRLVLGENIHPTTIEEANFQPNRLLTLRTKNSAAYKGIYALLIRAGAEDFLSGDPIDMQTFFADNIDIHHIFPERWCKNQRFKPVKPERYNSIINKTPISKRTNQRIGGSAPSIYLPKIEVAARVNPHKLDTILESHHINPLSLRADDFDAFFDERKEAILQLIEKAMGKSIPRDQPSLGNEEYDEGPQDWDENDNPDE